MPEFRVGISCVNSLVGQGVVKSLAACDLARRLELTGFDYVPGTVGGEWVKPTYLLPDILRPGVSEEQWLDALTRHIEERGIEILLVGIGFELPLMAKHRERILARTGCRVLVSSPENVERCEDKYLTARFLAERGLNPPATWLPGEAGGVVFPAVVKPRTGTGSKGLRIVRSQEELDIALAGLDKPMIQEEVGSRDTEYTCGALCFGGEVKSVICLRRVLRDGNTNAAWHDRDTPPAIEEHVREAVKALAPDGPANLQLRLDSSGRPRVFEINLRFSGSTAMRAQFGVNEPEMAVKAMLGLPLPVFTPRFGRVLRFWEELYVPEGS
jgi:carbamoyl-phosphate synthase large subunit